jgi:hypothetical protein
MLRHTPVRPGQDPVRISSTEFQASCPPPRSEMTAQCAVHENAIQLSEGDEYDTLSDAPTGDARRGTSVATTLLDFPIPPMQNPVGALPMIVSRATTPHPVASLVEACRAITFHANHIRNLLEQTRTRGEHLPLTNLDTVTAFERAWRELNEELLISIYGNCDVELEVDDVRYVDCIAKELRESPEAHWVLELFREDDHETF